MHASNVALLVLATSAAATVLAAPIYIRNVTDASPTDNLLCSLPNSCSQDSGAAPENKRGEPDPLSGSSPQKWSAYSSSDDSLLRDLSSIMPRDNFDSHQEIKARGRQEINSDQLAARNIAGDITGEFIVESAEAVDNRKHQKNLVRGVPEVRTETMPRDGVADDFVAALLKARVSEIIPVDPVSLASRAYHDLD